MRLNFLEKGDKIAIISPAGRVSADEIHKACQILKSWELVPEVFPNADKIFGSFAGTKTERLTDLQRAINAPEIKAVLCSRGGYGVMELLPELDFSALKIYPKTFIGFSDITALHAALALQGVPSLHAPMARNLARNELSEKTLSVYKNLLFGVLPKYEFSAHKFNRLGEVSGEIVGGNLSVFSALQGTKFELNLRGKILLLEDVSEPPHKIDRMLRSLRMTATFSELKGVLVGAFTNFQEDAGMQKTLLEIVADNFSSYDFPVAFGLPFGHIADNFPVPLGVPARFEVGEKKVNLEFEN